MSDVKVTPAELREIMGYLSHSAGPEWTAKILAAADRIETLEEECRLLSETCKQRDEMLAELEREAVKP